MGGIQKHIPFMQVTDTPVLRRMLRPLVDSLRDEVLKAVVAIQPDPKEEERYHELADKNTEGTLSPEERSELESMVSATTLLSILSMEARMSLAARAA